ncbi:MAG: type II secretion system F family protein [Nocardioidaceae bacterium]
MTGLVRRRLRLVAAAVALGFVAVASPAYAADGSIDHVQEKDGALQILYSVPGGAAPDLDSVAVQLGDTALDATAEPASQATEQVQRTTVLAIDVSNSMKGARFEAAKQAAQTFLSTAPDDLLVGLVTFAGEVKEVATPSQDHEALAQTIDGLTLSQGTQLYNGVKQAVAATGKDGSRSVLVLSDGADSTDTPITAALDAIRVAKSGQNTVKVDVVAIAQAEQPRAKLTQIANAGRGTVLDADDPAKIEALFAGEAAALAQQILVTAPLTDAVRGTEGQLSVSVNAGDQPYSGSAFVSVSEPVVKPASPAALEPSDLGGTTITQPMMLLGLTAAAVAFGVLIITACGGLAKPKTDAVQSSIEAYTRQGAKKLQAAKNAEAAANQSMKQQAVDVAQNLLKSNKDLESKLGTRLEAAGMSLKPAEWLLLHAGVALGLGIVLLLVKSGSLIAMLLGLVVGAIGPWFYLGFKQKRRIKAFNAQLPDTLQLMAGSLSAGLSLAQSVDTVVREGTEPIAGEFRRAIIETRLGVEIEDALSGIADRMGSKDFEWIVMAIRIQREVGGNLAELLNKVAETIREREYLHRQVLTLSAEGRLSVWVLGGLPPGFMAYLMMANPTYITPMFHNPIGWAMLITMALLETAGVLWMKKLVKVDV